MKIETLIRIVNIALEREWPTIKECLDLSDEDLTEIHDQVGRFNNGQPLEVVTALADEITNETLKVSVWFSPSGNGITLHPEGYNDMYDGEPVLLEMFDGKCAVRAWSDDQEDPIGSIVLKKSEPEAVEEMITREWDVPMCRTSYQHNTIRVKARTEEEAIRLAEVQAGNHEYSEKEARYDAFEGAVRVEDV